MLYHSVLCVLLMLVSIARLLLLPFFGEKDA